MSMRFRTQSCQVCTKGFLNTHGPPSVNGLNFGPDETIYEHYFAKEFPARNLPIHQRILAEIVQGSKEDVVLGEVKQSEQNPARKVFILWAGETPIGYRLAAWDKPLLLPERK